MSLHDSAAVLSTLHDFASSLTRTFRTRIEGDPEDQLKGPIQTLLQQIGSAVQVDIASKTESRVEDVGRPDIAVAAGGLLTGYIELKAPGTGVDIARFTGHNKQQWNKFRSIPNLIYTDGNDWVLTRSGEIVLRVRLTGDVTKDGTQAITEEDAAKLTRMLQDFFSWHPIPPTTPKKLAEMLAPLCHYLRDDVFSAVRQPNSVLAELASEWRQYLFPDAGDAQFADAYAQTVTYALLLARFSGQADLGTDAAVGTLQRGHSLLAQALRLLTEPQAREEIAVGVDLITRSIEAVDPERIRSNNSDLWLYFYEDFLAAYDRKLRNNRGVYYTPIQVVQAQINLVSELLAGRFNKPLAYADDGVVLLDPATGTGTYPLAAFQHGLDLLSSRLGPAAVGSTASKMAANIHAFEILVGPYAVAHLRLSERILDVGGSLPTDGVHVYLADTLESPYNPPQKYPVFVRQLTDEHRRALEVKRDTRVLVCIGNPPYDRQQIDASSDEGIERKGGWVRFGQPGTKPLLEDFLAPARAAGAGGHLKNLYNDYVYFWRWALWKVFEKTEGQGIVSFITASSYLRGPGFVGMREVMRRIFDELWIIDLEGDNFGARKTENIFDEVRTPVAIAVGVRYDKPDPNHPARVHYTKLTGTREEKLMRLADITKFEDLVWSQCFTEWMKPFLPPGAGDYFSWPLLTDLFPWQHSGAEMKRTWPIGETREVLKARWNALLSSPDRKKAFHETRDRKTDKGYLSLSPDAPRLEAIDRLPQNEPTPEIARYGYRSLDRQWVMKDSRLGDFMRPALWNACGPRQVYLTSLLTSELGLGPAAMVTAEVPDRHHFSGRGAKDVIPLWRDANANLPNITEGILACLAEAYQTDVSAEDLFAYAYALLATPTYVDRFAEELAVPGPRLPLTQDLLLFQRGIKLGSQLIQLHTYGDRFTDDLQAHRWRVPQGRASYSKPISERREDYPRQFAYELRTNALKIGDGEISPVDRRVNEFSISGRNLIKSWLGYRMEDPAGRSSSPLDKIRPERWTLQMTQELLELIWILEATIDMYPDLDLLLDQVVKAPVFTADDLPKPSNKEQKAPGVESNEDTQQDSMEYSS